MSGRNKISHFLFILFTAAFLLLTGSFSAPASVRAETLRLNEIGRKWKASGNYSFRLTRKKVLYCRDKSGKQTIVAKNVSDPFCEKGKVVYQTYTDNDKYEDMFAYYCYEPKTGKRSKYSLTPLGCPLEPVFYYKNHLMLHRDLDYGTLYCINTTGNVKKWKTIPLVAELKGYSWSFKRIGSRFYYNDWYFMDADKTSVGIFNMKTDKVKILKNAYSAVIAGKRIYYVTTKLKNHVLPVQKIKVCSCSLDGSKKKVIKSFLLKKKVSLDDFDAYADGRNVYYNLCGKCYRLNYKTGRTAVIAKKTYDSRREKLKVIG